MDELPSCPVCFELFVDPRLFRCGHTVCFACSSLIRAVENKIKCPMCNTFTEATNANALPKNFTLIELLEMMKNAQGKMTARTNTHDTDCIAHTGSPIEFKCLQCDQMACARCFMLGPHKGHPSATQDDLKMLEDAEAELRTQEEIGRTHRTNYVETSKNVQNLVSWCSRLVLISNDLNLIMKTGAGIDASSPGKQPAGPRVANRSIEAQLDNLAAQTTHQMAVNHQLNKVMEEFRAYAGRTDLQSIVNSLNMIVAAMANSPNNTTPTKPNIRGGPNLTSNSVQRSHSSPIMMNPTSPTALAKPNVLPAIINSNSNTNITTNVFRSRPNAGAPAFGLQSNNTAMDWSTTVTMPRAAASKTPAAAPNTTATTATTTTAAQDQRPARIYVMGGVADKAASNHTARFDPSTRTWTVGQPLMVARNYTCGVAFMDHLCVIGGHCEGASLRTCERASLTSGWETMPSLNIARQQHCAAVLGDRIYVVGGLDHRSDHYLNSVEVYDEITHEWTALPSMSIERATAAVVAFGGCLCVLGGSTQRQQIQKTVEIYDPRTRTWQPAAGMIFSRRKFAACAHGGFIYAIGGFGYKPQMDRNILRSVERYDGTANRWLEIAPMIHPRQGHSAVVCNDKIYVFGGFGQNNPTTLTTVEVYDPATGRWQELAERSPFPIEYSAAVIM